MSRTRTILFDVGACYGDHFFDRASEPNTEIYAFEPEPKRYNQILFKVAGLKNYKTYPFAISEVPGKAQFNISPDSGCSSLHEFSNAEDIQRVWHRSFSCSGKIEVVVIRLETFMEQNKIPHINELHIDTQGSDLAVLRSLGKYINVVDCGEIEVPRLPETALYKNQHTKEEALKFLEANGFEIVRIWANDEFGAEENIAFRRGGLAGNL